MIGDPLRQAPSSFADLEQEYVVGNEEDQLLLSDAAQRLLDTPIFKRVLNRLEIMTLRAIVETPVDDRETLFEKKVLLEAVKNIRAQLRAMAEDQEYKRLSDPQADHGRRRIPDA